MFLISYTDYGAVESLLQRSEIEYEKHGATIEVPIEIAPKAQRGSIVFAFDVKTAKLVDLWVLEEEFD